jgi:hypothetical protein
VAESNLNERAQSASGGRWSWPVHWERHTASGGSSGLAVGARSGDGGVTGDGEGAAYVWLTFPERLLGPEPADCEAVFGEDYGARVLERALSPQGWWLWWTESRVLARIERQLGSVRRARHLPDERPRNTDEAWVARGTLRPFGAALLPPRPELQQVVLQEGPSLYSEFNPNFVIGLAPLAAWSPRGIERWCREAKPGTLALDPLVQGGERVCMLWNGDVSIGLPEGDAKSVLAAVAAWASGHGVGLERG